MKVTSALKTVRPTQLMTKAPTAKRRAKNRVLYLCADRGIAYGGTKGASIHIREFADAKVLNGGVVVEVQVPKAPGAGGQGSHLRSISSAALAPSFPESSMEPKVGPIRGRP